MILNNNIHNFYNLINTIIDTTTTINIIKVELNEPKISNDVKLFA